MYARNLRKCSRSNMYCADCNARGRLTVVCRLCVVCISVSLNVHLFFDVVVGVVFFFSTPLPPSYRGLIFLFYFATSILSRS
jgi:hypothetical protein